jgi:hypothetical protein
MLKNKFTLYNETGPPIILKDAFHYRQCPVCLNIFKYPNITSGMDPAPMCCNMMANVVDIIPKED